MQQKTCTLEEKGRSVYVNLIFILFKMHNKFFQFFLYDFIFLISPNLYSLVHLSLITEACVYGDKIQILQVHGPCQTCRTYAN